MVDRVSNSVPYLPDPRWTSTTLACENDKICYQMCLSFRRRQRFRGLKTQKRGTTLQNEKLTLGQVNWMAQGQTCNVPCLKAKKRAPFTLQWSANVTWQQRQRPKWYVVGCWHNAFLLMDDMHLNPRPGWGRLLDASRVVWTALTSLPPLVSPVCPDPVDKYLEETSVRYVSPRGAAQGLGHMPHRSTGGCAVGMCIQSCIPYGDMQVWFPRDDVFTPFPNAVAV